MMLPTNVTKVKTLGKQICQSLYISYDNKK